MILHSIKILFFFNGARAICLGCGWKSDYAMIKNETGLVTNHAPSLSHRDQTKNDFELGFYRNSVFQEEIQIQITFFSVSEPMFLLIRELCRKFEFSSIGFRKRNCQKSFPKTHVCLPLDRWGLLIYLNLQRCISSWLYSRTILSTIFLFNTALSSQHYPAEFSTWSLLEAVNSNESKTAFGKVLLSHKAIGDNTFYWIVLNMQCNLNRKFGGDASSRTVATENIVPSEFVSLQLIDGVEISTPTGFINSTPYTLFANIPLK